MSGTQKASKRGQQRQNGNRRILRKDRKARRFSNTNLLLRHAPVLPASFETRRGPTATEITPHARTAVVSKKSSEIKEETLINVEEKTDSVNDIS